MSIEALERACLAAWPARVRMSRYGWEHCATAGRSGRANAVWPLAWSEETSLQCALEDAAAWCAAQHIKTMFKLSDGVTAPPELALALARAGYAPHTETLVMTRTQLPSSRRPDGVELHDTFDEQVWAPLRESAPDPADAAERADIVARIKAPRVFAVVRADGAPAALGMGVLSGDLLGVYLMRTAPWARGNGMARQIVRTLIYWGGVHEATSAYLQVEEANAAAVRLYVNEGFEIAYRYRYWSPQ